MSRASALLLTLAGLGLGVALCVTLALWQGVEAADLRDLAARFSWMGSALVLLLSAALMLCGAEKWKIFSPAWHGITAREPKAGFFLRHFLWQNWVGQFVPTSLALVLGRGVAARHLKDVKITSGVGGGLFDQAMDFAFFCAMLPGAALVLFAGGGWDSFFAGSAVGTLLTLVAAKLGARWMPQGVRTALRPLLFWSFARAWLTLLRLIVGVKAFGLSLALLAIATLTPIVAFVALVPLTPGNLGLAEWGWVGGLAFMGQDAHEAALYVLGFRLLVLLAQTLLLGLNEIYVRSARRLEN